MTPLQNVPLRARQRQGQVAHRVIGRLLCCSGLDMGGGGCQGRLVVTMLRLPAMVDPQNDDSVMKMVAWRLM